MLKNYFIVTLRNLRKNKVYSAINITGLAVSLAASVLLLLWVKDELSFDSFHKNAANIYRASAQFTNDGKTNIWSGVPGPIATYGKRELPEIEATCRIMTNYEVSLFTYNNKNFIEDKCGFADPSFFTMFSFPLLKGDPKRPFTDNRSIVISETTAKKYFDNNDPIGKTIKTDNKTNYTVTGVMKDIPSNSTIKYDFIFPLDILKAEYDSTGYWKSLDGDWGNYKFDTYFLLTPGANAKTAGIKLTKIHQKNQDIEFTKNLQYLMQPLAKVHLYKADGAENGMQVVRIFFIVSLIILLIACINYVNLVTARATKRAKEISMRKIIGAGKWQLFRQFIGESLIVFLISMAVSVALIYIVMPVYNELSGKKMEFSLLDPNVLSVFGVTMLATILLAGIYPALLLSSFKPLQAMKGKLSGVGKTGAFRKVLVVVQFSFSIILIISTVIIGNQLKFIREKNLGFDKENILTIDMRDEMASHYDAVKAQLLKQPGITGITASGQNIMSVASATGDADWDGKKPSQQFIINNISVERDLLKVLNLQMVAGTGFTGTPADSSNYIFNETAIEQMGIKNPIGKRFTFHETKGIIAGVVKDFHFNNMHNKIEPIIIFYYPDWRGTLYIKTTAKDAGFAVAAVEKIWKQYSPSYPFKYSFMDEKFNDMYKSDEQVGKLFNCFAVITILISCLGLLGLVTYTAETKVKEIGIRKTLGASVGSIVGMISKDFVILVIISSVISFPVAYWAMTKWLQDFAYRTPVSWWVFAVAALSSVVIALLTVSFQAIKAALANPVQSLRTE